MGKLYAALKKHAELTPDKWAIIDDLGEGITYLQLLSKVEARVRQLLQHLQPGQKSRVALSLHEGVEIPVTIFALNRLGVVVVPLNPALQTEQMVSLLHAVEVDKVIIEPAMRARFDGLDETLQLISLEPTAPVDEPPEVTADSSAPDIAEAGYEQFLITLSSGSTGAPKPIIFSEQNKLDRSRQAEKMYGVNSQDVILCASPFFHSLGQRLTFLPLLVGATLVQLTRFTPQRWATVVERERVTFTIPVSSHLHELVGMLLEEPARFRSLRGLVSSSAAIANDVKQRLFDSLTADFHEMYGASEVATATDLTRKQALERPGSVGLPCPGVEIKIVDEAQRECPPNEIGEIIVRSPLASPGYYHLPEVTRQAFVDGFFYTGDLGYLDEAGYLYFVNRKKEIIIAGGMNIYPSDIEQVLDSHPAVTATAVVGIHDRYLGEVPVAVVVVEGEDTTIERELRGMVHSKLAPYQQPMRYFLRSALPKTASGKVDKIALQDELNGLGLELSLKLRALQGAL
ncbi:MAG: acyl--CoA ligase [Gammaproteobacteria bacterium]|jgi:long-chain acyl-CoA synthetase|nr:acyl--CoA ligase [Gammaproteobacteria bacterium]